MQTFLPYFDIIKSIKCLDTKRLGKQRVEAMQILKALSNPNYGWQNHPAVKMWRGYETLLTYYLNTCIDIWKKRGFRNTMLQCYDETNIEEIKIPKWFGNKEFHDSHKSNLLRKFPEHYEQFNWKVSDNLPYVWPI